MPSPIQFPDAKKILDEAIDKTGVTVVALANKLGKSQTAVSQYRSGKTRPDVKGTRLAEVGVNTITLTDTIKAMAEFFHQKLPSFEVDTFTSELTKAWTTGRAAVEAPAKENPTLLAEAGGNMLVDLAAGRLVLNITCSDYPPFSGEGCFFNKLFDRFFTVTGLRRPRIEMENGLQNSQHANSDLVYGFFDSIDRMLRMNLKFWRFPIRIGLGAICAEEDRHGWQKLHKLLSKSRTALAESKSESDREALSIRIKPIVIEGEVGHLHCLHRLQISEGDMRVIPRLDIEELANELVTANAPENRGSAVPVVCVDEFAALMVLKQLGGKACSVFPMNSQRANQKDDIRLELPQYYCSIATKRNAPEAFQEFLRDGLVQFLSTEIETTANLIAQLAEALYENIYPIATSANKNVEHRQLPPALEEAQRWSNTWSWIMYTLHLTSNQIKTFNDTTLPWTPILWRARQIVQSSFHRNRAVLVSLVDLYFTSQQPVFDSDHTEPTDDEFRQLRRKLDRLCDVLDISMDEKDKNPKRYLNDPTDLIQAVENALLGQPQELQIDVTVYDPLEDRSAEPIREMKRIMRGLQNTYDALPEEFNGRPPKAGQDAALNIRKEIDELSTPKSRYAGENGRIIVARSRNDGKPVGGVCITGLLQKECQYRYLWVDPTCRGSRIGARMIDEAISFAKDHACNHAFVEVLPDPQLKTAIKLFIEKGFAFWNKKKDGRAVLIRKI